MKHYFLDTNIVVDFLTRRGSFAIAAAELFEAALAGKATLYVASLSFSNIHYILRKENTLAERISKLSKLARLVRIVSVDAAIVQQALAVESADFEDSLQHFAAASVPVIEAIVTRDPKGFRSSSLPVLTPVEALNELA